MGLVPKIWNRDDLQYYIYKEAEGASCVMGQGLCLVQAYPIRMLRIPRKAAIAHAIGCTEKAPTRHSISNHIAMVEAYMT